MEENKKILVVYYSYTGNTRKIADLIKENRNDVDLLEIKTIKPYSKDYNHVVNQGQNEVESGYKPEIEDINLDIDKYDTIVLGTPVWWYTIASAMLTFLNKYDLKNKKVVPFATNGGWIGHTFKDIRNICSDSVVENEINILFSGANLRTSNDEIKNWINKI